MKLQQSTPQASIHDIYVLEQVAGQNVQGKTQKQSTLEINLTDMRMMGNDGCNDFGGKITKHSTDKMELIFGDINATEMYCDELSNKVGQSFYEVKKYKREGVLLMLMSESNEELLRYKKVD
jgi:heat shock protein HslJ